MSSESVCQVARSWVEVGSFHTRLVVRFMIFTASVRNILGIRSHFNYLSSMVANDAIYTQKIKSRIAMAKTEFHKTILFTSKRDLKLTFYSLVVNERTTSYIFKTSTWCSLCVECVVRISEQTANFALYNIS
jgi:hypothetical protein